MLTGAEPSRIQCLTYTTAAAAEMALRLRRELAKWAIGDTASVAASLLALGLPPTAEASERARALFALVLDLPGGMRIETIHAFCQSLLRRFPLEANVSPHFRLLAEADAQAAMLEAQERVLAGADPSAAVRPSSHAALEVVASATDLRSFFGLARQLSEDRDRLAPLLAAGPVAVARAQRALLGVEQDEAALIEAAVAWPEEAQVSAALQVIASQTSAQRAKATAQRRLDWLSQPVSARIVSWSDYADSYIREDGLGYSMRSLVGDRLEKRRPDVAIVLGDEVGRVLEVIDACRAARTAALSAALLALALPITQTYAAVKQGGARLDYGDLVDGTFRLLRDPGAAWVLQKLDGGLDHLLLDEVQDTSAAQWAIAGALVAEFFAGEGARPAVHRTIFAVGDRKQSIFSFQGAEPDAFDLWRARLRRLATEAGESFRDVQLDVSFRSTSPVLALVDAVFADPEAARGVTEPGLHHESDRAGQAGSVLLWPLEKYFAKTPPPVWDAPQRREAAKGAAQRLAEHVADWIFRTVGHVALPSRGRLVRPGDILVLVRRRDDLARSLVRALKHLGVPVAGLDRMMLTEQPAVADLLALGDALLLPQDDLAVACVLTSPLGGLDDDDLMALAPERDGSLWDALRLRAAERPSWAAAWGFLAALFARVDFTTPHALLAEALGPLGGRARLLARLGAEAVEPIDELLTASLAYGEDHPPSLQGFLHWLRRSAAEVKRQPEAAGDLVRLMTVHGAKGLQAPIVILPDTTGKPPLRDSLFWGAAEGLAVPVWAPEKDWRSRSVNALRDAELARDAAEENRLLYVALTRAEDRLLICGADTRHKLPENCWYRLVERGFARLDPETIETPDGVAFRQAVPQTSPPDRQDPPARATETVPLPAWAGSAPSWQARPPPVASGGVQRLAPSRPRDAEYGSVPPANSPLSRAAAGRFERGRLLHALLQHLPDVPQAGRAAAARRYLAAHALDAADAESALAEVLGVLQAPALADAFAPGSRPEVPLTGVVAGQVVGGLVDRLAVTPHGVLLLDYKTNRRPPAAAVAVPLLYLRQMAAYRAILAAIYPDRPVRCVLVWTSGATVMELPPGLLDRHAPGAGPAA